MTSSTTHFPLHSHANTDLSPRPPPSRAPSKCKWIVVRGWLPHVIILFLLTSSVLRSKAQWRIRALKPKPVVTPGGPKDTCVLGGIQIGQGVPSTLRPETPPHLEPLARPPKGAAKDGPRKDAEQDGEASLLAHPASQAGQSGWPHSGQQPCWPCPPRDPSWNRPNEPAHINPAAQGSERAQARAAQFHSTFQGQEWKGGRAGLRELRLLPWS